jgi:hypothetical protein
MIAKTLACLYSQAPPFWKGAPGVGKTAAAVGLARRIGVPFKLIHLSHDDGCEVHGTKVLAKETQEFEGRLYQSVTYAPPDYVLDALRACTPDPDLPGSGKGFMMIFDEITITPPPTHGPALKIFGDYTIAGIELPREKVGIIACGNPSHQAAGGWKLPLPTINRFTEIDYKVDPVSWANDFPGYWGNPPTIGRWDTNLAESDWSLNRTKVAAFIRQFPELLNKLPENGNDEPFCSCRTWDFVSRHMTVAPMVDLPADDLHDLLIGSIGAPAALQFRKWLEMQRLPDPRELLDKPDSFDGKYADADLFYIVKACAAEVMQRKRVAAANGNKKKDTDYVKKSWENIWKLLVIIQKAGGARDVVALTAFDLCPEAPRGLEAPVEIAEVIGTIRAAGINRRRA